MIERVCSSLPTHPDYIEFYPIWEMVDDCLDGARTIKQRREQYLPKTEGMAADKQLGEVIYRRYLHNAQFPDYAQDYFLASSGLLKQADPVLNFPDDMRDKFVPSPSYVSNKSFYDVYGEVQDGVMKYSRAGVLLDPPNTSEKSLHEYPLLVTYDTYSIINWGTTVYKGRKVTSWVILNESYYETNSVTFGRELKERYRFLGLKTKDDYGNDIDVPMYYTYEGGTGMLGIFNPPAPSDGMSSVFVNEYEVRYPNINGKYLDHIPFYCFTGTKMSLTPERPICQSLCEACINMYGLSADYREYLYKQGFGILFGKGFSTDSQIYAGVNKAFIVETKDADLKMVESSGSGLAEYRLALSEATIYAKSLGLAILKGNGDETGVSVAKRQGFKTASLKSISKTVAEGFTLIAKTAAEWAGLSKEDVDSITIIPNIDFSSSASTTDLTTYQNVTNADTLVISDYDLFLNLKAKGMTAYATYAEYRKETDAFQKERDKYLLEKEIERTKALKELDFEMAQKQKEEEFKLEQKQKEEEAKLQAKYGLNQNQGNLNSAVEGNSEFNRGDGSDGEANNKNDLADEDSSNKFVQGNVKGNEDSKEVMEKNKKNAKNIKN